MKTIKRIGPQMQRAIEIVRENPGCCIYFVAKKLHPAAANGNNNAYGYNPVHRAIRDGLIQAIKINNTYRLTVEQ